MTPIERSAYRPSHGMLLRQPNSNPRAPLTISEVPVERELDEKSLGILASASLRRCFPTHLFVESDFALSHSV